MLQLKKPSPFGLLCARGLDPPIQRDRMFQLTLPPLGLAADYVAVLGDQQLAVSPRDQVFRRMAVWWNQAKAFVQRLSHGADVAYSPRTREPFGYRKARGALCKSP